jgi:PIN domain nuclease of toxin-antitoxin system
LRALLDTHTLLWWLSDDPALTRTARKIIAETRNTIVVSAASAWEIATKVRLGKPPTAADLSRVGLLPGPHKDPFDRMLIAQSQGENIPVIINDKIFEAYGVRRLW